MDHSSDEQERQEKLRLENEQQKLKLALEHGASFHEAEDNHLPPDVENQWLNYITNFENIYKNAKRLKVYDYIGKPEFKPLAEIEDGAIAPELHRLYDLLRDNGVAVDTICDVDERVLYRFITEELFVHETDDIRLEGAVRHFIYEEFHPNHEYDINRICKEFFEVFMGNGPLHDPVYMHFTNEMQSETGLVQSKEIVARLERFRQLFHSFELHEYSIISMDIKEESADLNFTIRFTGKTEAGDAVEFAGAGAFSLIPEFGLWSITRIDIPGVKV